MVLLLSNLLPAGWIPPVDTDRESVYSHSSLPRRSASSTVCGGGWCGSKPLQGRLSSAFLRPRGHAKGRHPSRGRHCGGLKGATAFGDDRHRCMPRSLSGNAGLDMMRAEVLSGVEVLSPQLGVISTSARAPRHTHCASQPYLLDLTKGWTSPARDPLHGSQNPIASCLTRSSQPVSRHARNALTHVSIAPPPVSTRRRWPIWRGASRSDVTVLIYAA